MGNTPQQYWLCGIAMEHAVLVAITKIIIHVTYFDPSQCHSFEVGFP